MAIKPKKSFGSSFKSAMVWNLLNVGVGQVMTLGIFLLLTTKLSPSVYGVFALAVVFVDYLHFDGRFAIVDTIVQRQRRDAKSLSTFFWLFFTFYAVMTAIFISCSDFIATKFDSPDLSVVLSALSLTLLLTPFTFSSTAKLSIDRDFKNLTICGLISKFLGGIVALSVAYSPYPEWALVAQRFVMALVEVVLLISYTRLMPSFQFDVSWAKVVAMEATRIFLAQSITKSLNRFVDIVIASFYGVTVVGIWRIADRIMQAAYYAIATPTMNLWVIMLSDSGLSTEQRRQIFLDLTQLGAIIIVPSCIGLSLISQDFINIFVDPAFNEAGRMLSLLAFFSAITPFYIFRNAALIALKRSRTSIVLSIIDLCLMASFAFLLRPFGTDGIILGLGLVYLIASFLYLPIILKEIDAKAITLAKYVAPVFVSSAVMGIAVFAVGHYLEGLDSVLLIINKVLVGAVVYVSYLYFLHRDWLTKIKNVILDRRAAA